MLVPTVGLHGTRRLGWKDKNVQFWIESFNLSSSVTEAASP